jgi:hypothetical protein
VREGTVPAIVIGAAMVGFILYVTFQGSTHAVDYAVTGSDVVVVDADSARVPPRWQRRAQPGLVMRVDVAWQASDSLAGGSYALVVTTPPDWRHLGCRPECEWSAEEGLRRFAQTLPRATYPLAATVDAEETGRLRLGFRSPHGVRDLPTGFVPAAWLVQISGDDVLGIEQVPLT